MYSSSGGGRSTSDIDGPNNGEERRSADLLEVEKELVDGYLDWERRLVRNMVR